MRARTAGHDAKGKQMARFLVLIYDDEQKWIDGAEGTEAAMQAHGKFSTDRADSIVAGEALEPTGTATSLRRDESGAVNVTDGPFVETKEALGGFYLIEAADLDAATELATEIPAPFGALEVRPVMVFS
jgi:hypothetical protein